MAEYLLYFNQQWVGEHTQEFLGGFAAVEVPDDEAAKVWAGKISQACGWPHEVRRFQS